MAENPLLKYIDVNIEDYPDTLLLQDIQDDRIKNAGRANGPIFYRSDT